MIQMPKPSVDAMIWQPPTKRPDFNTQKATDRAAHAVMDINADGKLSRDEWGRTGRTQEMFDAYDADGDGSISEQEYLKGREYERAFAGRDRNGDGSLSKLEWEFLGYRRPLNPMLAMASGLREACLGCIKPWFRPDRFESYDANGDGKVTAAEYVKQRVERAKAIIDIRPYMLASTR